MGVRPPWPVLFDSDNTPFQIPRVEYCRSVSAGATPYALGKLGSLHPIPHPPNFSAQKGISLRAWRQATRIGLAALLLVVGRRGDRQHRADRLAPVSLAVGVDESHHHLGRRSSSAWAKKADALRKISFTRRSSRTSRSSCLRRSRSSLVRPGRIP